MNVRDSRFFVEVEGVSYECITVKLLKIWTLEKFAVITVKFEQGGFTIE